MALHVTVRTCDPRVTARDPHSAGSTVTAWSLSLTYLLTHAGHLHSPQIIPRGKDFFSEVNILLAVKLFAFVREGLFSCSDTGIPIFTLQPDKT